MGNSFEEKLGKREDAGIDVLERPEDKGAVIDKSVKPEEAEAIKASDEKALTEAKQSVAAEKEEGKNEKGKETWATRARETQYRIYLHLKKKFAEEQAQKGFLAKTFSPNRSEALLQVSHLKSNLPEMLRRLDKDAGVKVDLLGDQEIRAIGEEIMGSAEDYEAFVSGKQAKNEEFVKKHVKTDLPGMVGKQV